MSEPTPPLDEFREAYDQDDNIWWAIGCGHHQNLFDAACERIDALETQLSAMRLGWKPAGGVATRRLIGGEQYVCRCGAIVTFQPPAVRCPGCGTEFTNWLVVARLPRDRYRVEAIEDGWDVFAREDGGAFA